MFLKVFNTLCSHCVREKQLSVSNHYQSPQSSEQCFFVLFCLFLFLSVSLVDMEVKTARCQACFPIQSNSMQVLPSHEGRILSLKISPFYKQNSKFPNKKQKSLDSLIRNNSERSHSCDHSLIFWFKDSYYGGERII